MHGRMSRHASTNLLKLCPLLVMILYAFSWAPTQQYARLVKKTPSWCKRLLPFATSLLPSLPRALAGRVNPRILPSVSERLRLLFFLLSHALLQVAEWCLLPVWSCDMSSIPFACSFHRIEDSHDLTRT